MGYVHDVNLSRYVFPNSCHYRVGTWTDSWGTNGPSVKAHTAADEITYVGIPVTLPQNTVAQRGSYFKSIDIFWETATAPLDALAATIQLFALPINGSAFAAPTSVAFTYDSGHDTAGERLAQDQHKMTLTITTPFWLDDDDLVVVQLAFDAALTSVIHFGGARVNYTLRL